MYSHSAGVKNYDAHLTVSAKDFIIWLTLPWFHNFSSVCDSFHTDRGEIENVILFHSLTGEWTMEKNDIELFFTI